MIPKDPFFADQWNMRQIKAFGVKPVAWDFLRGNSRVVICIIDGGCDLTHPDLHFVEGGGINIL